MPTELEELVDFLHHGNTQVRQIATENLVPYSKTQPTIFKAQQLVPVNDLKLLVKDYSPIAHNALTILVNISSDPEILKALAEDDAFLETLLLRVTNGLEPNGDLFAMLLANLAKHQSFERLIALNRTQVPALSSSTLAITQLLELFNVGPTKKYNKDATYDYLTYVFADLAKYPSFQTYLTTPPPNSTTSTPSTSSLEPLTTFLPLTTHPSHPRRLGTATLLRNLALAHPDPLYLLQPAHSVLPALLLPLCSSDQSNITAEEMETLPEECQFLTPGEDKQEERDRETVRLLLETLYLLMARSGADGRDVVRGKGGYVIIRECHLRWADDEEVRGACERIVDVLMAGDGDGDENGKGEGEGEQEKAEGAKGGLRTIREGGASGSKNLRGSGLPQGTNGENVLLAAQDPKRGKAVAANPSTQAVKTAGHDDEDDEENDIVPIF